MHLALWTIAGLLAVAYMVGGAVKVVVPREKLVTNANAKWVEDFAPNAVRGIGVLEILGAIGLVLPAVLDIAPVLVPLAALGLAAIMTGAAYTRLRRGEQKLMAIDLVYLALAAFVAWGRFGPESFST